MNISNLFFKIRQTNHDQNTIRTLFFAGSIGIVIGMYLLSISSMPQQWFFLLVMGASAPFFLMILGSVRKPLLAAILIDIPLQLDINLAYRIEASKLGAVDGFNVSITTIALAVLYILWLFESITAHKKPVSQPLSLLRTSLPLVLFLSIACISMIAAQDIQLSFFKLFMLLQMFLLFIYILGTVRTREDVLFLVTMLLIGLLCESLIMVGLRVIGHSIKIGSITARIDGGVRVGGTMGGPNTAAAYLSLLLAPAVSILMTQLNRYYKLLAITAVGFGVIALIFTLSRGGWLAFALSVGLLFWFAWRRGWLSLTIPIIAIVIGLILAVSLQEVIGDRLFGDDDGSAESRVPLIVIAFKLIRSHPVLGVGINNFAFAMLEHARNVWLYVVHNKYLLIWAEIGIGGLLAYIWFLLKASQHSWQCWKLQDRTLSPLALGFGVAILGHMVHMHFDTFQNRSFVQLLFLNAGLITAMYNIGRQDAMAGNVPEA